MNLYAYAGYNPVAYTDPFGLRADVEGGEKEMAAYQAGKNAIATCALLCGARQAASAQQRLATLNAAENDHSVKIVVTFGQVPGNPGSPAGNGGPLGGNVRGVFVNTGNETMGANYQVNATVAHEVYESYGLLQSGNPRAEGPVYQRWHGAAITNAEDPALIGAGLPSRTSRTVSGTDRPTPIW